MKLAVLTLKNLLRNKVRTALTALSIFFLVAVFTMIATVLRFLEDAMAEQKTDVKSIVTERYRIPSRFDRRYIDAIVRPGSAVHDELRTLPGFDPEKHTFWIFSVFSLDPEISNPDNVFFLVATLPEKLGTMTDGLEGYDADGSVAAKIKRPPISGMDNIGIVVGPERLAKIGKKVGDRFKAYAMLQRDNLGRSIEFEFEVVDALPAASRWTQSGFMDAAYLERVLHEKKSDWEGKVNLGWFQTKTAEEAARFGGIVEKHYPDIKCELLSSAVGRFLEPFKDLLFGVKYLLVPAIFAVMCVIVANAISISVRERQKEIAVLKVLGFSSRQILILVLGEALLIGVAAGAIGSGLTYVLVNAAGIKIPIGFFPVFFVPAEALLWGPLSGGFTAFVGSVWPAWAARSVKVVEVFSKVA